jgi:hypothetical protein
MSPRILCSAEAKFAGTQFTVAPPQHRLYFLPEPQRTGIVASDLGAVRRDSEVHLLAARG